MKEVYPQHKMLQSINGNNKSKRKVFLNPKRKFNAKKNLQIKFKGKKKSINIKDRA